LLARRKVDRGRRQADLDEIIHQPLRPKIMAAFDALPGGIRLR
jgi:hypothetical protein